MAYENKGPRSRFTNSFVQRKIYRNNGCFSPPLSSCNTNIRVFIKTNQVYFAKKLIRALCDNFKSPWGKQFSLKNPSTTVSIKAEFDDDGKIHIKELYEHPGLNRDIPTLIGLGIVVLIWGRSLCFSPRKKA
jgi:hypothetical protein